MVEVKLVPISIAVMMTLLLAYSNISIIVQGGVGKNGSTVALANAPVVLSQTTEDGEIEVRISGTSVLSPIIPFSMVVVPAFIIYRKSVEHVYENHPVLYILAFGMVAAKVTNRLVVAHMSKSELEYLDSSLIGPAMLFLNQYFNFFIQEYIVLWLCLVWVTLDLLRYCSQVCLEICDYLKIELFRIPVRPPGSYALAPGEKNGVVLTLGIVLAVGMVIGTGHLYNHHKRLGSKSREVIFSLDVVDKRRELLGSKFSTSGIQVCLYSRSAFLIELRVDQVCLYSGSAFLIELRVDQVCLLSGSACLTEHCVDQTDEDGEIKVRILLSAARNQVFQGSSHGQMVLHHWDSPNSKLLMADTLDDPHERDEFQDTFTDTLPHGDFHPLLRSQDCP
uniref:Uncharacterized protein n=1 Tax=Timema bartmani TaxID=61472 RepID=A0A7R9F5Y6_9NEOP|nr:unnamed protein product [Timema bartmani]